MNAKYFKESCWLCSDEHFSFKKFAKILSYKKNISNIRRPVLDLQA